MLEAYRFLSKAGLAIGSSSNDELECRMPAGYKKRMSEWHVKLLREKLAEIEKSIDHRIWVSSLYHRAFKDMGIKTIELSGDYASVFLRYPVLVKNKMKALEEATKRKIEIGDWFLSPVHPNLRGWERAGYKEGICPEAEKICKCVINLPTHQGIGESEVEEVVEFMSHVYA
jgi:dTDP-4-amino-4,6-dideoxygalactose transaminase